MSFRKASSLSGKRLILKTTAIVGFSVLVVFVVLFSVQGLMIQQGVLEEQKLLVSQQAFLVAELFDARILEASTLLELYAINPDTVEEHLDNIMKREPLFASVSIIDGVSGEISSSSDPTLPGVFVGAIPAFANNFALGSLSFVDPYPMKLSEDHEVGIPVGVRLNRAQGKMEYLVGVIGSDEMSEAFLNPYR